MIDNFAIIKQEGSDTFDIKFMPFVLAKFNILINLEFPVIITICNNDYTIKELQDTEF